MCAARLENEVYRRHTGKSGAEQHGASRDEALTSIRSSREAGTRELVTTIAERTGQSAKQPLLDHKAAPSMAEERRS
jgi:hypothetical protein